MRVKWESNKGLFFVNSKEIMREKILGREFLEFWAKHEGLFFMLRRFVPKFDSVLVPRPFFVKKYVCI